MFAFLRYFLLETKYSHDTQGLSDHTSKQIVACILRAFLEPWSCYNAITFHVSAQNDPNSHVDVIKWKHFPRYWSFGRGIHRSPVNSPHKSQWRGALMFSLIFELNKSLSKHCKARDLRRHCAHYDVIVTGSHTTFLVSHLHLFVHYIHL